MDEGVDVVIRKSLAENAPWGLATAIFSPVYYLSVNTTLAPFSSRTAIV